MVRELTPESPFLADRRRRDPQPRSRARPHLSRSGRRARGRGVRDALPRDLPLELPGVGAVAARRAGAGRGLRAAAARDRGGRQPDAGVAAGRRRRERRARAPRAHGAGAAARSAGRAQDARRPGRRRRRSRSSPSGGSRPRSPPSPSSRTAPSSSSAIRRATRRRAVEDRQNRLADDLYKEVILYQRMGDNAKAVQRHPPHPDARAAVAGGQEAGRIGGRGRLAGRSRTRARRDAAARRRARRHAAVLFDDGYKSLSY